MNSANYYRTPDKWPTTEGGSSVGSEEQATPQDSTEEWPTLEPRTEETYHPLSDDRIFSDKAVGAIESYIKRRKRVVSAGDNDQICSDLSTVPSDQIDPLQRLKDVAEASSEIPSWLRWENQR